MAVEAGPAVGAGAADPGTASGALRLLASGFQEAEALCPGAVVESWYAFAGRRVRVRVVGPAAARHLHRPFAHLALDGRAVGNGARPDLTIELWHEAETGVTRPGCVPRPDPKSPGGVIATADGRIVVHHRAQTRTAFDRRDGRIVGWIGDAGALTLYELGRPLHSPLLLWHKDRGVQPVHAGFVARAGDGLLLGGPGGSGKSTAALTCLHAGLHYLADDYVGIEEATGGRFTGHSLYTSTHVAPDHLTRFPVLVPHEIEGRLPFEDKSLALLAEIFPGRFDRSARIRAIALPRVVAAPETRVRPASKVEALLKLAPSSLLMLPHAGAGGDGFEQLSRLVGAVPTFWLDLGRDLDEIPRRVEDLLAEVCG